MIVANVMVAALFISCTVLPPPNDPEKPVPAPTGCPAACDNLRRLGCPEGKPDGETCEAVCENAETSEIASVHPECLAKITSCDQIDGC